MLVNMTFLSSINIDGSTLVPDSSDVYQWTYDIWQKLNISDKAAHIFTSISLLFATLLIVLIADYIVRKIAKELLHKVIARTRWTWDDRLMENKALDAASRLILVILTRQLLPYVFIGFPRFTAGLEKFLEILIIICTYQLVSSILKTIRDLMAGTKAFADKPLDSYLQVVQIFLIFMSGTLIVSSLTGSSPWSFLVSLGAASAILMLVFKDTILGFVASIQVSANDSIRVGDWIEMPKYGVDGDVMQINLNNVRVRNFDKTVVTIPTYTLLSDAFKNYRGMEESGGRRIKRAINIKISSIRYLASEEIEALKKIQLLKEYIDKRETEIRAYNQKYQVDSTVPVNGRRMTNVGLFRSYILSYAKHNPEIHKNMTLMVRQLAPTEHGLPLELYMFTNGTNWGYFEDTMADLFDHLLAAIKYFHLEVFESPASDDLRQLHMIRKVSEVR
ncbi:mechanosensitive ion channel protein MscS [Niabella ginsenosidivorans]|uniref:Mechanosensitive ion channel protein MscS n=1 Tax=Niabella ginsenosidivorans TaxID=1176587 RepID=A0A1A9I9T6_9BACT|nr:mechanosensitive ion channel domain-containing protein [Niabella ginsenosidivorans]ANH83819.1 mechanosensitive ion channel protein MscS [Niabella ginsenosidivorans]